MSLRNLIRKRNIASRRKRNLHGGSPETVGSIGQLNTYMQHMSKIQVKYTNGVVNDYTGDQLREAYKRATAVGNEETINTNLYLRLKDDLTNNKLNLVYIMYM